MTRLMHGHERIINYFNKKYSFKIEDAPAHEQRRYAETLESWDNLKAKRDLLLQQAK